MAYRLLSALLIMSLLSTADAAAGDLNAACLTGDACTDATNHVCDTTLTPSLCKIKISKDCTSNTDKCVTGAACIGNLCVANGALNGACLANSACTDATNHVCDTTLSPPLCKIAAAKSCASSTTSCVAQATCTSDMCTCATGYTAVSGKCPLNGGLNGVCLANSACTDATNHVCDAKVTPSLCKIKVAKTCTSTPDKCVTGAACTGNTNTQCACSMGYTPDTTTGICNGASSVSKMTGFVTVVVALFLGFNM